MNSVNDANETLEELIKCGVVGKLTLRGKKYIVYVKDENNILQLLQILGAINTKKEFLNIINIKNKTLNVNRKINFEMANIKRSTQAAIKQMEDINIVLKNYKKEEIDDKIYNLMMIRKKNQTASLNELIDLIGNISKSSLNYRFNKIKKMAEKYKY